MGKLRPYAMALLWVAGSTVVAFAVRPYALLEDEAMIYLLGVVLAALKLELGASIFAAASSIIALDFLFLPPRMTLALTDGKRTLTFAAMIIVAAVISGLSGRLRRTARATDALYQLNVELSGAGNARQLAAVAVRHLERLFGGTALVLLRSAEGPLETPPPELGAEEIELAHRAWNGSTFVTRWRADGYAMWVSMQGIHEPVGVIGLKLTKMFQKHSPEGALLLDCARELATAIERMQLGQAVRRSQLAAETEHMRSSLLSAVSHDLKTPLSSIVAAGTTLLSQHSELDSEASRELLSTIVREGDRLTHLVQNLLAISRLESPTIELRKTPEAVEDIVSSSLHRMRAALGSRKASVNLPADLPFVLAEPALVDQVVTNLLENVARYTPSTAAIEIAARHEEGVVNVQVGDAGPGIPEQEREKVFEKFYRGSRASKSDGGVGLGLTICRAIIRAHGGKIAVRERPGGGTLVEFTLPAVPTPVLEEPDGETVTP
jgi:two-component system sensor histidine kinase KdpD